MQTPASTAPDTTRSPFLIAIRILSIILGIGILVMAALAGNGLWLGERGLITGHGHLGNSLFVLAGIQFILAMLLYQKKQLSATHMVLTFALVVLLLAQAGLGYVGRTNVDAKAWHIPNGVLLMGIATFNIALAWLRPSAQREAQ